jgi:hypothetical protein
LVLHHVMPSGELTLLEAERGIRTRKRCVDCQFLHRENGRYVCSHPRRGWVLAVEVVKKPFPCEDYRRKKRGGKR